MVVRHHLRKLRKTTITREELKADSIFIFISALVSFTLTFLFDVHHSFYSWPIKLTFIFQNPYPYFIFVPIGALFGLFIIKLLLIGVEEEEKS